MSARVGSSHSPHQLRRPCRVRESQSIWLKQYLQCFLPHPCTSLPLVTPDLSKKDATVIAIQTGKLAVTWNPFSPPYPLPIQLMGPPIASGLLVSSPSSLPRNTFALYFDCSLLAVPAPASSPSRSFPGLCSLAHAIASPHCTSSGNILQKIIICSDLIHRSGGVPGPERQLSEGKRSLCGSLL